MKKIFLFLLLSMHLVFISSAQTLLLPFGATWKYLDNGSNQGTAWRSILFNDELWKTGEAELGYGDGDEATVVRFGSSDDEKYITTYFRKTFIIADISGYSSYTLSLKRDDGAVVYINGTEVWRSNMPSGTISYNTLASGGASNDDGNAIHTNSFAGNTLVTGINVIAVEIHQSDGNSSDISFDLALTGTPGSTPTPPPPDVEPTPPDDEPTTPVDNPPSDDGPAELIRGPYLQMGSQNAVTLRWRTDVATNSRIDVGTVYGTYTRSATNSIITKEHEVRITGLTPGTKYFYRFGSSTQALQRSSSNYFYTAPLANTTKKIGFAVFGDCGRNSSGFRTGSLNAYLNHVGNDPAELMLLLGDNAYSDGTDAEYQAEFFNTYSSNILKNHVVFPTPGNHDYINPASRSEPYYQIFSMPTAAECGGVPSGTEAYYSFDWGNIHFLSLDSYGTEDEGKRLFDTLSPQVTWVKKDLAANTKKWVIAFWHHPPYTKGSHNSDTESELIRIRQNFMRILERYGVDLILCGHSHNYERSYLLDRYYGFESSFNTSTHAKSTSSGEYDGSSNSCPYNTDTDQGNRGTVYVVSGSSGADGDIQSGYPHNAMPFSIDDGGMFYFEVEDNRLDAKFLRRDGAVADKFTMFHDAGKTTGISINPGGSAQLTASWPGAYKWSTGATTRTITVIPSANTTYKVVDNRNCITDVFNVSVTSASSIQQGRDIEVVAPVFQITPNLVKKGQRISIHTSSNKWQEAMIIDNNGRLVQTLKFSGNTSIETWKLPAGTYFIKPIGNSNIPVQKFTVAD
jgi:hypothetical protein